MSNPAKKAAPNFDEMRGSLLLVREAVKRLVRGQTVIASGRIAAKELECLLVLVDECEKRAAEFVTEPGSPCRGTSS